MIVRIAELKDIEKAVDLAISLQADPATRCRHLFANASRKEMYDLFLRYVKGKEENLLLVEEDDVLLGCTCMYWMDEDEYVSYVQGPYGLDYNAVASCLYDYIVKNYKGYKFYTNTASEHKKSIEFFKAKGFDHIEEAVLMTKTNYESSYWHEQVLEINKENDQEFYRWIDQNVDEDTYWNAERISKHKNLFIILGYFENGIKGHIIGRGSNGYKEIIAFTGDESIKEELFKSFITACYRNKIHKIDLYTEEAYEESLGYKYDFKLIDNNNCFLKYL